MPEFIKEVGSRMKAKIDRALLFESVIKGAGNSDELAHLGNSQAPRLEAAHVVHDLAIFLSARFA